MTYATTAFVLINDSGSGFIKAKQTKMIKHMESSKAVHYFA